MLTFQNQYRTSSAKYNSEREPRLTKKDRRIGKHIVSKNHRTITAQVKADLSPNLAKPVLIKTFRRELHNARYHRKAATAKPLKR